MTVLRNKEECYFSNHMYLLCILSVMWLKCYAHNKLYYTDYILMTSVGWRIDTLHTSIAAGIIGWLASHYVDFWCAGCRERVEYFHWPQNASPLASLFVIRYH
jgi:hypothetical protein